MVDTLTIAMSHFGKKRGMALTLHGTMQARLISSFNIERGTKFTEGGHYSPVNNVLGGQNPLVNNVREDNIP